MRITVIQYPKKRNSYKVVLNGRTVGTVTYWGASLDEAHEWSFLDKSTGVYGSRPGINLEEYQEIIDRFYEKKEQSVGHILVDDEYKFQKVLKEHNIFDYWNEGKIFFFNEQQDLFTAGVLK